MRCGDMPVRDGPRLVDMRAQMHHRLRFVESSCEVEIGGRGIDGVRVEQDEPIDLTRVQVSDQRFDIGNLVAGNRKRGVRRNQYRLAHIAQHTVDGQRQCCNRCILIKPRQHRALARAGFQVLGQSCKILLLFGCPRIARDIDTCNADRLGERSGKGWHFAGAQTEAMLRLHAGGRSGTLDGVQPVHTLRRILAAPRVVSHQLVEPGVGRAGEKVRVERDNHVSIGQRVLCGSATLEEGARNRRIILHHPGFGVRRLHGLPLPRQRRRSDCGGEDVKARAVLPRGCLLSQRLGKLGPLAILATEGDMLRAIWIVEIKQ